MTQIAFAPRPEYRHPDALGAVFVNDTTEVNLRELFLASPYENGAFTVDNPAAEAVLARHPALMVVTLPPPSKPAPTPRRKPEGSDA